MDSDDLAGGRGLRFTVKEAVPYPSGVVGLHYVRAERPV